MSKTTKSKVHGKEVSLKADRNLLARLLAIGHIRKVDLQELLSYSLGPVPLALCTPLGCLVKTNKANILHSLESQLEKAIVEIPRGCIYVVDAMAMIQKVDVKKLPGERTFLNLAHVLLRCIVNLARVNGSNEIHLVADTYRDQSIKKMQKGLKGLLGVHR